MAADTYDPILGLILQGTGNNNNSWGTVHDNSGFKPIARAIAGGNIITAAGGTVDLSTVAPPTGLRLDADHIQMMTGSLTSDLTIQVVNVSKTWRFWNRTTGAFNVYVKVPGGAAASGPSAPGGLVQIPAGVIVTVICDGAGTLIRADDADIGSFRSSGKAAAGPGEIVCNGASYARTALPDLFAKIGTVWGAVDGTHFNVPDLVTSNRFLRAAGGSVAVGTTQTSQNLAHTHPVTGAPSVGTLSTDVQGNHSHTATDLGHVHQQDDFTMVHEGTLVISITGSGVFGLGQGGTTRSASANVQIAASGSHAHNVAGAPGLGTLATSSQGGAEVRPESAVALICIRY